MTRLAASACLKSSDSVSIVTLTHHRKALVTSTIMIFDLLGKQTEVTAEALTHAGHRRLMFTTPGSDEYKLRSQFREASASSQKYSAAQWVPLIDGDGGAWSVEDSSQETGSSNSQITWILEVHRVLDWATGAEVLPFDEPAIYDNGIEITIADVQRCTPNSFLREDGREYVQVTLIVRNGSTDRIDLSDIGVTVRSGPNGSAAKPAALSGRLGLSGLLNPGKTASAEATYGLVAGTSAQIDIDVDPDPDSKKDTVQPWSGAARPLQGEQLSEGPTVTEHTDEPQADLTDERRLELLEEAVTELAAMIGLEPVKRQVEILIAQLRMSVLRQEHGLPGGAVPHHLVFAGPPGTGKTTVARIIGKAFAGLNLLAKGHLVEAHRGDLVAGYVGHTAPKTGKVINRALDGVLFIDEAYALSNTHGRPGDRDVFGDEALQVLLKRAEDDRHRLVIILAGYEDEMDQLLATNPGLASRFNTRVDFPGYAGTELAGIARAMLTADQEILTRDAETALDGCCRQVGEYGWADMLGNGRFIRTLCEKARAMRDLRLAQRLDEHPPTREELVTLHAEDLVAAFAELTTRLEAKVE